MFNNLVSMFSKSLISTNQTGAVKKAVPQSNNPFILKDSENPFLQNTAFGSKISYGKNCPVEGGYFAGYYNGTPNIVGRKLFIEV